MISLSTFLHVALTCRTVLRGLLLCKGTVRRGMCVQPVLTMLRYTSGGAVGLLLMKLACLFIQYHRSVYYYTCCFSNFEVQKLYLFRTGSLVFVGPQFAGINYFLPIQQAINVPRQWNVPLMSNKFSTNCCTYRKLS